jgi:hypothetical protein
MPIIVNKLPGESIIINTYSGKITAKDIEAAIPDFSAVADGLEPPIYRITDGSESQVSFPDLVMIMPKVTLENNPLSLRDKRFIDLVIVPEKGFARLGAESLRQMHYGGANVRIFDTLEDAIAYAREKLQAG